jgi:hypothetical protein
MSEVDSREGSWWLPDDPDTEVAGRLEASAESVQLHLIGSFRDVLGAFGGDAMRYSRIYGVADGKLVTLFDCIETSHKFSAPGTQKQELIAHWALVGAHVTDLRVRRVLLRTTYMPEWVEPPILSAHIGDDDTRSASIRYDPPDDLECNFGDAQINLRYGWSSGGDRFRNASLEEIVSFDVQLGAPTEFADVQTEYLVPLQNLITLATDHPNAITHISVWPAEESEIEASQVPVAVYYPAIFRPGRGGHKFHPDDPYFRLADIIGDYCRYVTSWLAVAERLRSVCNLFFSNQYAPPQFSETRFLVAAQAVELFHRLTAEGEKDPPDVHAARLAAILDAAPPEHAEWLENALRHSNDKRLRRRLRELVERIHPVIGDLFPNPSDFAHDVVATRNYFTHWDPEGEGAAAAGAALIALTNRLQVMLQVLLMLELGFPIERCAELVARTRRIRWMREELGGESADG